MTVPKVFRKNKKIILAILVILTIARIVAGFSPYQIASKVNYSPEEGNVNITGTLNLGYWMNCIQQLNSTENAEDERVVDLNYNYCSAITYKNFNYEGYATSQGYFCLSLIFMIFIIFDYYYGFTKNKDGERTFAPMIIWVVLLYCSSKEISTFYLNAEDNVKSQEYTAEHNTSKYFFIWYPDWAYYLTIASAGCFLLFTLFLVGYYKY